MGLENTSGTMVGNTRVIGSRTKCMDLESMCGQMVNFIKVNTRMTRKTKGFDRKIGKTKNKTKIQDLQVKQRVLIGK